MSRVRFEEVGACGRQPCEARFRKPAAPPAGYTGNTVVTEWLTLNCRGSWGSRSDGRSVHVRFAEPDDCARAVEALTAMGVERLDPAGPRRRGR